MQKLESGCFIILGRTTDGKVFRPSDWDHRLCGVLSLFNDGKLLYSAFVRPVEYNNEKSVFIAGELKKSNPGMWNFMRSFARDNELQIEWPDVCLLPD